MDAKEYDEMKEQIKKAYADGYDDGLKDGESYGYSDALGYILTIVLDGKLPDYIPLEEREEAESRWKGARDEMWDKIKKRTLEKLDEALEKSE